MSSWEIVKRCDVRARLIADRHYSRQTPGHREFMPPGETFVLWQLGAVWGVVHHLDPRGRWRWRCSIFRNETAQRASNLIREATALTLHHWWKNMPDVPLSTEVTPSRVRPKTTPGHTFIIAGWRLDRIIPAGHGRPERHVLHAPGFV